MLERKDPHGIRGVVITKMYDYFAFCDAHFGMEEETALKEFLVKLWKLLSTKPIIFNGLTISKGRHGTINTVQEKN